MAAVSLEQVTKDYTVRRGRLRALDNFSLSISDGELLVLLGPSGCGKTTLLRLIAGLESPTDGSISIGSRCVVALPPKDRNVAMVFQSQALFPHMTARRNMAFSLKYQGCTNGEIDTRVSETASLLGIVPLLDRKPDSLSGGQRQRVALARAMVRRPDVFLLDEPLSSLDAPARGALRIELKSVQRSLAATMIYVTHDQEEALAIADRIAVMHHGVLQQCGTPGEIYDRPANRFVAGFVGAPPMNFLRGSLEASGPNMLVSCSLGRFIVPPSQLERHRDTSQLTIGIRPEDLEVGNHGATRQETGTATTQDGAEMRLSMVEPLGSHDLAHLEPSVGERLVARLPPKSTLLAGQTVSVRADPVRIHFFSEES